MTRILKYEELNNWEQIAQDFISQIQNPIISESEDNEESLTDHIKDIFNRLGFNLELIVTFGTGVKFMFPIVSNLIDNMQLEIQPSREDIVLLCITTFAIMNLQHRKESSITREEIKNKLNPEVQMKFGNPRSIVNKLLKCFKGIYDFIKKFPRLFGVAVESILDMFSYTSMLIPAMNAIGYFCDKYDLTPDNLIGNLYSLGVGIMTITSQKLYQFVKNKIQSKSNDGESEPSVITDPEELNLGTQKLIQEQ
jgi:hypothetical protein